mmetsp:Transcript_15533/g.37168  ORF Transcript_15533/g.37168 Transcript_15533/m.37168 type:complete len:208 (+) Transcript_15533:284-907(+)
MPNRKMRLPACSTRMTPTTKRLPPQLPPPRPRRRRPRPRRRRSRAKSRAMVIRRARKARGRGVVTRKSARGAERARTVVIRTMVSPVGSCPKRNGWTPSKPRRGQRRAEDPNYQLLLLLEGMTARRRSPGRMGINPVTRMARKPSSGPRRTTTSSMPRTRTPTLSGSCTPSSTLTTSGEMVPTPRMSVPGRRQARDVARVGRKVPMP